MHSTLNCGLQYEPPNCFAQYTGCFKAFSLILEVFASDNVCLFSAVTKQYIFEVQECFTYS